MAGQVEVRRDLWTKRDHEEEGQSHQPDSEEARDKLAVLKKSTMVW